MKKFVYIILLFIFTSVYAQAQNQKVTFIAKAGLDICNYYGPHSNESKTILGPRIGLGVEIPIAGAFSLQPSIFLAHKGSNFFDSDSVLTSTNINSQTRIKAHQWYIEVPINAQLRFPISDKVKLITAFGPYFAYGAFGKISVDGQNIANTFGKDGMDYDRFDMGLNGEMGFDIHKFYIGTNFALGLTRIQGALSNRNLCFTLLLGYRF